MDSVADTSRVAQLMDQIRCGQVGGSLINQAARLIVEQMLAAEVDEALGRASYQRRDEGQSGYRNGYKTRTLKTAEGPLEVQLPQVRGTSQPFRSELWHALGRKSPALQKLAMEMYARGLSTRDIEDLLRELCDGDQTLLSKSAVSEVTEALWEEYQAFVRRDLGSFDVVYLFCDAVHESLRQQGCSSSQAILVTWGICSDGGKVLLHMSLGNKESQSAWLEHLRSLVSRSLPVPLTITTDGAPGLIAAVEAMWPESERVRCWFHKMKNVLDKVPEELQRQVKRQLEDVRDAPDHETGRGRAQALIEQYRKTLPSAMDSLGDDLEASLSHLKLPTLHQRTVRTTNLCERSFVEERRRTKVIPRFFDEKGCLKLVFASLWRTSQRWRNVQFSPLEKKQLDAYIRVRRAMGKTIRDLAA